MPSVELLTNRIVGTGARAAMRRRQAWVRGHRVAWREYGAQASDGLPPYVLVHGLAVSSRYMHPLALRLSWQRPVYVPDLPGHGSSAGDARNGGPPPLTGLADTLAAWMEQTGIRSAVLIANSFGCNIATELAARRPDLVEQLVLAGPTGDREHRSAPQQLGRWLFVGLFEKPSLVPVLLRELADSGTRRALDEFAETLGDPVEQRLPMIRAHTLVVRGERDATVPLRWAEEVTDRLPNGHMVQIPGAGHTLNYSAAPELARVVRRFVEQFGGDGRDAVRDGRSEA